MCLYVPCAQLILSEFETKSAKLRRPLVQPTGIVSRKAQFVPAFLSALNEGWSQHLLRVDIEVECSAPSCCGSLRRVPVAQLDWLKTGTGPSVRF